MNLFLYRCACLCWPATWHNSLFVLNIPGMGIAQQDAITQVTALLLGEPPCYRTPGYANELRGLLNLDLGETEAVTEAGLGRCQLGKVLDGDDHVLGRHGLR